MQPAENHRRSPEVSMIALRQVVGAIAILVIIAGCGTSTPSIAPTTSSAATTAPDPTSSADPTGEPSAEPSEEAAGSATWWVDTGVLRLAPETTVVKAFLVEGACASGQSPQGRIADPVIEYRADAVVVTFTVAPLPGNQDCQGNPEFPVEITLSEPLGSRTLLDGGSTPPRDATTAP
jgi:hypothetical protein